MIQRIFIALFALTSAVLGFFAWQKSSDHAALRKENDTLSTERDEALNSKKQALSAKDDAEANAKRLASERDSARKARVETVAAETPAGAPAGNAALDGQNFLAGITKMMGSDEGKKMMRNEALTNIRKQYADFARSLKLSPQDTDLLISLLVDRDVALSTDGLDLLSGGLNEEAFKKMKETEKDVEAQYEAKLKKMLGDRYGQFEEYERTLADREQFAPFEEVFSNAGLTLSDTQRNSLSQIMSEERKRTPSPYGEKEEDVLEKLALLNDDSSMEKWAAHESDFHRRVLQAAPRTLTPDQIAALEQGFAHQLDEQKFTMKMGRELFKGMLKPEAPAIK